MGRSDPPGPIVSGDYVAEYLSDWSTPPAGELIDHVTHAIVREVGSEAFAAPGRSFDDAVGRPREDDENFALLQAIRADWVMCEASVSGAVGDTWVRRAAAWGGLPGVSAAELRAVAGSVSGLFEIWPGRVTWIRDRLRGVCLPLRDPPVGIEAAQQASALWELRVLPEREGDGVRLARRPLEYPLSLIERLDLDHRRRWSEGGPRLDLMLLRRARLAWVRARRVGPFERYLDRFVEHGSGG